VLDFPLPEKLLQQYFLDIVEKDIRERVSAKSSRPLQAMARMVLESVGSELSLRRTTPDISYWKGKGEVDFVVNTQRGVTPIQVTYGEPQPRHEEALDEFFQQFPNSSDPIYVTPENFDTFTNIEV